MVEQLHPSSKLDVLLPANEDSDEDDEEHAKNALYISGTDRLRPRYTPKQIRAAVKILIADKQLSKETMEKIRKIQGLETVSKASVYFWAEKYSLFPRPRRSFTLYTATDRSACVTIAKKHPDRIQDAVDEIHTVLGLKHVSRRTLQRWVKDANKHNNNT